MLTAEGNINFPKLSPSPTHPVRSHMLPAIPGQANRRQPMGRANTNRGISEEDEEEEEYAAPRVEPLSFEQALAMGRGVMVGRQLPSPMPNGFKPGDAPPARRQQPMRPRSDSDDDWC